MRGDLPGESDDRQMWVRLNFEQIPNGAHDQAVHDQSGREGGEFGGKGVHVCLRE
jgi:hypothetical protein